MGRLILLALFVLCAVLLWKAYGPGTWGSNKPAAQQPPQIKGPDDDEEFLWTIDKNRFKARRAREEAEREEEERLKRARERYQDEPKQEPED